MMRPIFVINWNLTKFLLETLKKSLNKIIADRKETSCFSQLLLGSELPCSVCKASLAEHVPYSRWTNLTLVAQIILSETF